MRNGLVGEVSTEGATRFRSRRKSPSWAPTSRQLESRRNANASTRARCSSSIRLRRTSLSSSSTTRSRSRRNGAPMPVRSAIVRSDRCMVKPKHSPKGSSLESGYPQLPTSDVDFRFGNNDRGCRHRRFDGRVAPYGGGDLLWRCYWRESCSRDVRQFRICETGRSPRCTRGGFGSLAFRAAWVELSPASSLVSSSALLWLCLSGPSAAAASVAALVLLTGFSLWSPGRFEGGGTLRATASGGSRLVPWDGRQCSERGLRRRCPRSWRSMVGSAG